MHMKSRQQEPEKNIGSYFAPSFDPSIIKHVFIHYIYLIDRRPNENCI